MTVCHVIAGGRVEKAAYEVEEYGREDVGREVEEHVDEDDSDEDQEYTLDLGVEGDRDFCASGIMNRNPSTGDSTSSRSKIGHVAITSDDALENGTDLDWALIEIDDPSLYYLNLLLIPGDSD